MIASVIVRQGHAGVGFWRGYPPTVKDLGAAAGAWAQRVPLVGAPLRAAHARSASFDVVLGLHLTAPVAGAFKYATLRYDDAGHEYLTNTSAGVRIVAPPHPC